MLIISINTYLIADLSNTYRSRIQDIVFANAVYFFPLVYIGDVHIIEANLNRRAFHCFFMNFRCVRLETLYNFVVDLIMRQTARI